VGAYWTSGGGTSPWEQHPDDDELLQILDGECDVTILTENGPVTSALHAGDVIIVPRGHWHRHSSAGPFRELYVTPGATLHSDAEDPLK
jgi:quercetin dioxygenase-like cupin family protein